MNAQHACPVGLKTFAQRLRERERLVGYWIGPDGTECAAGPGYDYVGTDGRRGATHRSSWRAATLTLGARRRSACVVRVPSPDPVVIRTAVAGGAHGVIIPMIDNLEEIRATIRACRRWAASTCRPGGPAGAEPTAADEQVARILMIDTPGAIAGLEAVCATPGLDAVYVDPAGLSAAFGTRFLGDPATAEILETTLARIVGTARRAGIACGVHCPAGDSATKWLLRGFTFATVSSSTMHPPQAAAAPHAVSLPLAA